MNIVLEAVVGSTAHGLASATSDVDVAGVFVRPTVEFSLLGYKQKDDTIHKVTPEKDITYHEVGKFLGLLMKSNPTLLELVYAEKFTIKDSIIDPILDAIPDLISSEQLKYAYIGMIKNNLTTAVRETGFDTVKGRKNLRHAIRLSRQGRLAVYEGIFQVRVPDVQEYVDMKKMPYEDVVDLAKKEFALLSQDERSYFFDKPKGYDFANSLLMEIRTLA